MHIRDIWCCECSSFPRHLLVKVFLNSGIINGSEVIHEGKDKNKGFRVVLGVLMILIGALWGLLAVLYVLYLLKVRFSKRKSQSFGLSCCHRHYGCRRCSCTLLTQLCHLQPHFMSCILFFHFVSSCRMQTHICRTPMKEYQLPVVSFCIHLSFITIVRYRNHISFLPSCSGWKNSITFITEGSGAAAKVIAIIMLVIALCFTAMAVVKVYYLYQVIMQSSIFFFYHCIFILWNF